MAKRRSLAAAVPAVVAGGNGAVAPEVLTGEVHRAPVAAPPAPVDALDLQKAGVMPGWMATAFEPAEMGMTLSQIDQEIGRAEVSLLERVFEVGRWLLLRQALTPHGQWERFVKERYEMKPQRAWEAMVLARRVLESPHSKQVRQFLLQASGGRKKYALALLGMSDDEIQEASRGQFLNRSLDDVGRMSYLQLVEELRQAKRDKESIGKQRDAAETKVANLQEANQKLRGLASDDIPQTALEKAHIEALLVLGRFQVLAEQAPEDEIKRDGRRYYNTLQQMLNSVMPDLIPLEVEVEEWGSSKEAERA